MQMKVSNPLTVIAIFAGLAETMAAIALVRLPPEIQHIFVYFVMFFPLLLVLLFFIVLYFKNTVLYAPSDFENEDNYLEANALRDNINQTVEEVFDNFDSHAGQITPDELKKARQEIHRSIEDQLKSTRDKITDFLKAQPNTTKKIAEHLGMEREDTRSILFSMKRRGLVSNEKKDGAKVFTWTLAA